MKITRLLMFLGLLLILSLTIAPAQAAGTINVDDDAPGCVYSPQGDPYAVTYCTIQDAVTDAKDYDTIAIAAGTYPEQIVVDKAGLILQGDGSYPLLNPAMSGSYPAVILIHADDITIQGLEFTNALGADLSGEQHGIWDSSWTIGPSGLTVDDCIFHDIQHGVRSYGPDLTVTNSMFYNLKRSGVHASGYNAGQPLPMTIRNNWFYNWSVYYKEGAGVTIHYDYRVGEVAYNYISGMRMGIAYYYGGPHAGYDPVLIHHNTIDMDYDPLDPNPVLMTMSMSFWGTGLNASSIIVRDNIFANARWYALYQEGAQLVGGIQVDNNLFYNNYWFYWPDYQYPYQWFGSDTLAQAGWYDAPSGDGFTFTNNLTAQDPLFTLSDPGPEGQWALNAGSPALGTASDGSNIGAWQGAVIEILSSNFTSAGYEDGQIMERSENSGTGYRIDNRTQTPKIGDDRGDRQYRTIFSFNTAGLPDDAIITGATLEFRQNSTGGNPFGNLGDLLVDIKSGFFYNKYQLEPGDFQAGASLNAVGSASAAVGNGNWYSLDLSEAALDYINKAGRTQFRLRFSADDDDDRNDDYLKVYGGYATGSEPVLVVEYYLPTP
jgi:hypothetical protein